MSNSRRGRRWEPSAVGVLAGCNFMRSSFPEGLAGGVGLAAFLNLGGQWRLAGGGGQVDGLLGGDDGFGETAGGSIRGGERVQRAGMVGVGEIDGVGGDRKSTRLNSSHRCI